MLAPVPLLLLLWLGFSVAAAGHCVPVSEKTATFHGNFDIVISYTSVVRSPRGVVKAPNGSSLSGVLVEVFDHPEIVLSSGPRPEGSQHRLAACMTDDTGSFDLKLAPGRYEIRVSKADGWQCASALIRVGRFSFRKRLDIILELAT